MSMSIPDILSPAGEINITGPLFEVGELVIPIVDYHKSRDLDKKLKALTESGGGKIVAVETVKCFPEYPPNKEYFRMLHFEGGVQIAAELCKRVNT